MTTDAKRIPYLALMAILVGIAAGCGGKSDDSGANPAASAVDPHFATAEALVEYFNSLTTREPVDDATVLSLFYAENDLQQRLIELNRISLPLLAVGAAMHERFQAPVDPTDPKAFISLPNEPAKIVDRSDQRAAAEYKNWDKSIEKLQLVKIGNRWWFSGYTYEHHPAYKAAKPEQLTLVEMGTRAMAAVAPSIAARVRTGELRTAEDTRKALTDESQAYVLQHPQEFQQYQAFVREHPELFSGHK